MMFEPVNDLARRLPRPEWTGDATGDWRTLDQHIANGRRMQSEAVACLARALMTSLRRTGQRIRHGVEALGGAPSHQA